VDGYRVNITFDHQSPELGGCQRVDGTCAPCARIGREHLDCLAAYLHGKTSRLHDTLAPGSHVDADSHDSIELNRSLTRRTTNSITHMCIIRNHADR